jgi:Carbohydrate family 9 binding domain-like
MPIRKVLLIVLVLACPRPALPFPIPVGMGALRGYVCERTDDPPLIDGKLNDLAWENVAWTEDFTDIQGHLKPAPRLQTTCAMRWDDDYFYIAGRLVEPHVHATLTQRDAVIYHDNDFEIFIDPDGDNHLYYELEINALNTVWDLLLVRPYRDGGPAVNAWDIQGLLTAVHVDGTLNDSSDLDQGWSVEIAIPWKVLAECAGRPSPPEPGHVWRMNFSRVQWRYQVLGDGYEKQIDPETGMAYPEDNWVWSPQGLIAMHYPENWGQVLFSGPQFEGNREHQSINTARALMDVYYAQRQWQENHGQYAGTIAELESEFGALPREWAFELEATENQFTARLCTPSGVMTVDETGRLKRNPLHPTKDQSCLKSKP